MSGEAGTAAVTRTGSGELDYREFWEINLQKMEEISAHIEKTLIKLEKKYVDFGVSYEELTGSIDLLLSIYSNYNAIQGADYLLKLKACLRDYAFRYAHEGIRFNVLYFLHAKVMELRSGSFDRFPRLDHELPGKKTQPVPSREFEPTHRWITFKRHGAWFILPFREVIIVPRGEAMLSGNGTGDTQISHGGIVCRVIDAIVPANMDRYDKPLLYILRKGADEASCYAASSAGRRILAGRDIMREKLRSYPHAAAKYVRLFGRNHIYLGG